MRRAGFFFALWSALAALFILAGCSPVTTGGQGNYDRWIGLQAGQSAGQTFTAGFSGLAGVEVYLSPKSAGSPASQLRFHLKKSPTQAEDIDQTVLPLSEVNGAGFYRFAFAPLTASNQTDYYLSIGYEGPGEVELASAPGTDYLNGSIYLDGQPGEGQLTFRLVYDRAQMALGLLMEAARWVGVLAAGVFLFILPGWAVLSAFLPGWSARSLAEKLALACGVSLSIYPFLLLWTDLVGVHLGAIYAWTPPILALVSIAWRNRKKIQAMPRLQIALSFGSGQKWANLALGILLVLIFGSRFWAMRSLDTGLWGDSLQHTEIAQLIVDHSGLFTDWAPYADLSTFTYHFGFHTWVAVFHWVTGSSVARSVLWVAQLANGLAVLALYPLALKLVRSQWAGVLAVLTAGLFMPMPMFYLNWGRFTQLAGQLIMPAAVVLLWEWLDNPRKELKLFGINCLIWVGLALTHYRILFLSLLFVPAYLIAMFSKKQIRVSLQKIAWLGVISGVLFLPWFVRLYGGRMIALFGLVTQRAPTAGFSTDLADTGSLFIYASPLLWCLLIAALGWGLWQRNKAFLALFLWWFLAFISSNPGLIGLSGDGFITNFTVVIAVYILMGPAVGALIAEGLTKALDLAPIWLSPLAGAVRNPGRGITTWQIRATAFLPSFLVVAVLALTGGAAALTRIRDLHTNTFALAARPDLRAFNWINQNISPNSRFLVNSFLAYSDTLTAGSDGGWWLPYFTRRSASIPPMNTGFEQGPFPGYQTWVNQLVSLIRDKGIGSREARQELARRGIDAIYIGQVHGRTPDQDLLNPQSLQADPSFRLVYHQDRVWIFKIVQ